MKRTLLFAGALLGSTALVWKFFRPHHPTPIHSKIVVITGATSNIGRATAHAFAARGARVILVARHAHLLAELQSELAEYENPAWIIAADITCEEELQLLINRIVQKFDRIDILINNACLTQGSVIETLSSAELKEQIEINLYGCIHLTRLVLPLMIRQGTGHIVTVSSAVALQAPASHIVYNATRHALLEFSKTLHHEIDGTGIRISTILPGWPRPPTHHPTDYDIWQMIGQPSSEILRNDPQIPARAIVKAVQYNYRQITLSP